MNHISGVFNQNQDTTVTVNRNSNSSFKKTITVTVTEAHTMFENMTDIINLDYVVWFKKCWEELGREKFMKCAQIARSSGKIPAKLFVYLLKEEMNKQNLNESL